MQKPFLCAAFVSLLSLSSLDASRAAAQEHQDFTHAYQTWLAVNFHGPIAGNVFFTGDIGWRMYEDFTPLQPIVRGAIQYQLVPGMFVGVGYGWQPSWRGRGLTLFTDEHRVYEQWQYDWTHQESGVRLGFRVRLEQRFRHPTGTAEVGVRLRQFARAIVPMTTDRAFLFVVWDEIFASLNDAGHTPAGVDAMGNAAFSPQWQFAGFDQNRLFIGLGYQVVPGQLRFELGYLNQWVRRPNNPGNGGDAMNHVALFQTFINWR